MTRNTILEGELPEGDDRLFMGYGQTKWVAERMCRAARQSGLQVDVFRAGLIGGDSSGATFNLRDVTAMFIKGCAQTKAFPLMDGYIDLVPVDWAARAIVHLVRRNREESRDYHLVSARPLPLADFSSAMVKHWSLRSLPLSEWARALSPDNALAPLAPLFQIPAVAAHLFSMGNDVLSRANLESDLVGSGIHVPDVDAALIDLYLRYFAKTGFVP